MSNLHATVVGAGLAGSEAAWQLARQGIAVTLIEMKPEKMSPAHHSPLFAELVCSNSLRSDRLTNDVGLLKEEMRLMHSLVMEAADLARVPAGGALAVDRETFSGIPGWPGDYRDWSADQRRAERNHQPSAGAGNAEFLRCGCPDCHGGITEHGQGVPPIPL